MIYVNMKLIHEEEDKTLVLFSKKYAVTDIYMAKNKEEILINQNT